MTKSTIAVFDISTEEDLRFQLDFENISLVGRTLKVNVRRRDTGALVQSLTSPSNLTVSKIYSLIVSYPKGSMSAWAKTEYEADVIDETGGSYTRIMAVRFVYDEPGKLVYGVRGNRATVNFANNQAVVTATGGVGPPGPVNSLAIGDVETLETGEEATATLTGSAPSQTLNLGLPKGNQGDPGEPGAAATVEVGTVTTGAAGSDADVENAGSSSAATLNFTIPRGDKGENGWAPELAIVSDGERRVQQVVDWQGGEGTKPATGLYVGASGLVVDIEDGVDIRGDASAATVGPGDIGTTELADGAVTSDKVASGAFASQAEAEAGTDTAKLINALRAKQSVTANAELGTFTPAGSDTASRTLRAKARETVSFPDYATVADAIAAGSGSRVIHAPTGSYAVGSSNLDIGVGVIEADAGAAFTGTGKIAPSGLTYSSSERYGKKIANTSIDAYSIYGNIFPDVTYYDVQQFIAVLPAGADLISHISAVAGYIRVESPINSIGNNAVALFGGGLVTVDNGAGWGLNVLLQDAATRTAHAGTGRVMLGGEFDFNVMSPNTQVIGISVGGNSLAQPTNANAFICNTLSETYGYRWSTAFASFDGCAGNALYMGLKEFGANKPSQDILASYTNGSGVKQGLVLRAENGVWNFVNGDIALGGGNVLLQSGYSLVINGQGVVGSRRTGWTAGSGTLYRGAGYDADYYPSISGTYQQAEIEAIMTQLRLTARRLHSLETDIRAHGLIG